MAKMIAVIPRNAWHRFHAADGRTTMRATLAHTGAIARRFGRAVITAWRVRRDAPLRVEMSDHMLRDMGVARDDIRRAGASRQAQWP
jgi:uncharacterized protein YjiS (DUF1127 family)